MYPVDIARLTSHICCLNDQNEKDTGHKCAFKKLAENSNINPGYNIRFPGKHDRYYRMDSLVVDHYAPMVSYTHDIRFMGLLEILQWQRKFP
jgi:hypothetical protein